MLFGIAILFLGTYLLSQMGHQTSRADLAWRMAILGVGLGPLQSLFGLAIQNSVDMSKIGVVTSANQFFRQIGSTVGVAIFGTLLTNNLNTKLGQLYPGLNLSKLRNLSAGASGLHVPPKVAAIVADGVTHVIFLSLFVVGLAFIATVMIPALPMKARAPSAPKGEEVIPAEAHL